MNREEFLVIFRTIYLVLCCIAVVYFIIVFNFCTSKNIYVSTTTDKFYQLRTTDDGQKFWRPVKKFIFKNTFRYILADDQLMVPDLIPYKEWLKQNDE